MSEESGYHASVDQYFKLVRAIGILLAAFPGLPKELSLKRFPRPCPPLGLQLSHDIVSQGKAFRCLSCLRVVRSRIDGPCRGLSEGMLKLVHAQGPGHKLHLTHVVETGVPVVYCVRCGRMASTRPQALLVPCRPRRTPELSRLLRGYLPGNHKPTLHVGPSFSFADAFVARELFPVALDVPDHERDGTPSARASLT